MSTSAISAASRSCWHGWRWCSRALLLNYFGQGAFVLSHGGTPTNPFFEMHAGLGADPGGGAGDHGDRHRQPGGDLGRLFADAARRCSSACCRASQILHTSETQSGQIYMPRVNLLIALGVMLLVVGFGDSSSLASAYGISVTGEMLMTTILLFVVMRHRWKWALALALPLALVFGIIDIGFFLANAAKVLDGGWVSIAGRIA